MDYLNSPPRYDATQTFGNCYAFYQKFRRASVSLDSARKTHGEPRALRQSAARRGNHATLQPIFKMNTSLIIRSEFKHVNEPRRCEIFRAK